MNIVLIGYRGCGKTTVGMALADRLGMRFADVDEAIRLRFSGRSIKAIYTEHGEAAFRDTECAVTEELLSETGRVIALGGGTVMQPAARQAIERAQHCLRFYLHADATTLTQRIGSDDTRVDRPSTGTDRNSAAFIEAQLAVREPTYRAAADHVIDVARCSADQAVEAILAHLPDDHSAKEG